MAWNEKEVQRLSKQFNIHPGVRLHAKAEDYHFPDRDFLSIGYAPPGGYVKDFGVIRVDGRLHLFHIDGRPGEVCWVTGNEISFGHASTTDYCHWIRHPMPLAVGDRPWENAHVWAPYVYQRLGVYYMFYMGSGGEDVFISYATSSDLQRWTRWEQGPIRAAVGRDPFVFDHQGQTVLLYTGHDGACVCACASRDMVTWEPLPDVIALNRIPGSAAESCSVHPLGGRYVLWMNDYGPKLAGFRAAYALSDNPLSFSPGDVRTFRFVCDTPGTVPSPELRVPCPTPLSIERIATSGECWFVCYFRWHGDRNRLFFGTIDWTENPAVIREISTEAQLSDVLRQVRME
ncbi:MAG: hypothetical protein IT440_00195 [Phycisphaeraceae bacterium]|nr:hypothetical protein [Phycisphaeraceae bacterium]